MRSCKISKHAERGLSLIVTLVIAAGASVLIGGVLYYTSTQSNLSRRVRQYDGSVAAAVAATEKVVTRITKDFQTGGANAVGNNLTGYRGLVPTTEDLTSVLNILQPVLQPILGSDNSGPGSANSGPGGGGSGSGSYGSGSFKAEWSKYEFADPQGQANQIQVDRVSDWTYGELNAKFPGLKGYAANYRVVSNVREKKGSYHIVSGVRQDVQIASVPLCQFQFFYVPDFELNPSTPGMRLNGRIHCNGSIYTQPGMDVEFQNHVTASRRILHSKHPADPVVRGSGRLNYRGDRESGLNTLNIPIGTNSGPSELRQLIEAPSAPESPASLLAQERFYNKADLVIVVSNDVVTGRSGAYNGGSVSVPWLATRGMVTRIAQGFYDQRECLDLKVTDVDAAKFVANYDDLTRILGRPCKTIWITDLGDNRKNSDKDDDWIDGDDKDNGKGNDKDKDKGAFNLLGGILGGSTVPLGAVRLINGATLPAAGLTIATPNPLYVKGPYNVSPVPACLVADAVTILSPNWVDLNGAKTLSSRIAVNTTVNAAIITGIVPTGGGAYSGGAENALRLLEDWSGKTLTFNGSIAVLYYSKVADAPWGGPQVYAPPTRSWSYDTKLADAAKIPPGMPAARTVFRSDWTLIKPRSKS